MKTNKLYFNKPQIEAMIVDAPEMILIKGRGTGKTEGDLAPYSSRRVVEMPRATFALVAASFQQILTRTLPPLIAGWERIGYRQGIHYLIGQKPPEKWRKRWRWDGPYRPPQKFDYTISWFNGATMQMVSQDRPGSTNGMSLDGIFGDEAKLLNAEKLNSETLPANRGVIRSFANNPMHHFLCFTTDMPVGTGGRWLLDKESMMDNKRVDQVKKIYVTIQMLLQKYQRSEDPNQRAQLKYQIDLLKWKINDLKRYKPGQDSLLFYQESSTLENIYALGIPFIRQMMRNLSEFEFKTSILNRKPYKLEDGFYPDLDEDKHGYFAYSYSTFYKTGYDFSALKDKNNADVDADYNDNIPIHIALDYNRRLCPMVVGQLNGNQLRIINGIESEYPEKLNDTLKKFCDYYKSHKRKVVYYWYDHTATGEYAHAGKQCDEVRNYLIREGWTVIEKYIGRASGHERRYTMYGHLLKEDGFYPYVLRINRDRCKYLLLSCYQAQAIQTKKGFGKDKKNELNQAFPAKEATHYSEALDMLVWGVCESGQTVLDIVDSAGHMSFI